MPRSTAIVLLVLAIAGCDGTASDEQRLFDDRAFFSAPSGITRVSASGEVLSEDPDDWRVGPAFATVVLEADLDGPNPVRVTESVAVTLNLLRGLAGGAALYVVRPSGDLAPVAPLNPPDVSGPGFPTFTVTGGELAPVGQPGLVRVVVLDGRLNVITYGDIEVSG